VICLREWLLSDTNAGASSERREALLELYLQSLFADERLGPGAGRHSLSAGVLRLVLEALSQEQASG
jgi:hypothetical protein